MDDRLGWMVGVRGARLRNAQSKRRGGGGLAAAGGPGSGGATCSSVRAQAAANRPGFSMGDCAVPERTRFTSVLACASQSNAVLQCGMTANFTCGRRRRRPSNDCRAQAEAFALCVPGRAATAASTSPSVATDRPPRAAAQVGYRVGQRGHWPRGSTRALLRPPAVAVSEELPHPALTGSTGGSAPIAFAARAPAPSPRACERRPRHLERRRFTSTPAPAGRTPRACSWTLTR